MITETTDFVLRRDNLPVKVLQIVPQRVRSYMRLLQTRYSDYRWSEDQIENQSQNSHFETVHDAPLDTNLPDGVKCLFGLTHPSQR